MKNLFFLFVVAITASSVRAGDNGGCSTECGETSGGSEVCVTVCSGYMEELVLKSIR